MWRASPVLFFQKQPEGLEKPVRYWSRSLSEAEKAYKTTNMEFIAARMGRSSLEPVALGKSTYYMNEPGRTSMDIEHDGCNRETNEMAPTTVRAGLWSCPFAWFKTSGSQRLIPLAHDRNGPISLQGRCTSIENNRSPAKKRRELNRC